MSAADDVLTELSEILEWHGEFYQDLHQNPELSFQEHRTADLIAVRLRALGYEVHESIGQTGLVGILENGSGKTVLARADMDALPVKELTDLPYKSMKTAVDADGREVDVMHACGHDAHVTCLLAAAELLSRHRDTWTGTFVALFQPAEELGSGARAMLADGLASRIPKPDVCLGQHLMGLPAGVVATRPGPAFSAADSIRITVYGKGSHGSMPHAGIDPVVLGSAIVMRLQTIVSREVKPGAFAVVTVGSFQSGAKSNVIPGEAVLLLNVRTYDEKTRARVRASIERIVRAECEAAGSPKPAEFEYYDRFPLTDNTPEVAERVSAAFKQHFGDDAIEMEPSTGSEDFSEIPVGLGSPFLFWVFGGFDREAYTKAKAEGNLSEVIPPNHNGHFAPVMGPALETGIRAMTVALLSYLGNGQFRTTERPDGLP